MSVNIKQNGVLTKISGLYNAYNGAPDYYVETTQTLSTTGDTTFTFTDDKIHTSSAVSPYASIFGMNPKSMTISEGQCVVVFPAYSEAVAMSCRLYIKSSGTGSNSPTNYSTDKVAIGTWIDGRTIYQQSFSTSVDQAKSYAFTHNLNVDLYVGLKAHYHIEYDYTGSIIDPSATGHEHKSYCCDSACLNYNNTVSSYLFISTIAINGVDIKILYYPESSQYQTLSNIDATLYLTVQFVEAES